VVYVHWVFQVAAVNLARFDGLKLVHERQTLAGVMPVAGLPRLVDGLLNSSGTLDYRLWGDADHQDRPLLKLRMCGAVQLQCQRCLEGFEYKIDFETALRLVAPEALDIEYDDDPDEPDCIAASAEMDLAALIEDEVLLALPPYPRHDEAAGTEHCNTDKVADYTAANAKILPFSLLQALKKK
jgi:uncharacterized protein